MRTLIAAASILPLITAPAAAGPLRIGWVAAEAKWVAHVDIDAFTSSRFGSALLENADDFDIDLDDLDELQEEIGIDLRTDVMSLTAYGTSGDPEDCVIIAVTNEAADEALERLLDHPDLNVREIEVDGYDLYVIAAHGERHYLHVRDARRRDRRIVVLAGGRHDLVDALKVIDGDAPSISMGKSRLPGTSPMDGSIVFVAAGAMDELDGFEPASDILSLCESVTIDVGEIEGELRAQASASAKSEENAANIKQVVKGMIALGDLIAFDDPDLTPLKLLTEALSVRSTGNRVTIRFRYDVGDLLDKLEVLEEGHSRDHDRPHKRKRGRARTRPSRDR